MKKLVGFSGDHGLVELQYGLTTTSLGERPSYRLKMRRPQHYFQTFLVDSEVPIYGRIRQELKNHLLEGGMRRDVVATYIEDLEGAVKRLGDYVASIEYQ